MTDEVAPGLTSAGAGWIVVLPVKQAARAKSRLGGLPEAGPRLARAIALDTIDAVRACAVVAEVVVVTDDADLAASLPPGVACVTERAGTGPNAAVEAAMAGIRDAVPRAALLADLPALRPGDLEEALLLAASVVRGVVPDAEGTGSTLVTASAGASWASAFGPSSFERHLALGCVELAVQAESSLRRDVDTPDHLASAAALGLGPRTRAWHSASVAPGP